MNFSDNDDDLFDYDPDTKKTHVQSSQNEFLNNLHDVSTTEVEDDIDGNLDSAKVRVAHAYYGACERFITDINSQAGAKSLMIVLNKITNGDFLLMTSFYELEMKISRRMIFLELSLNAFKSKEDQNQESSESFIKIVKEIFNVSFTDFYVKTFFLSTINISMHALTLDRAQYLVLSKKLGIPVKQFLFEDVTNMTEEDHGVYFEDYKNEIEEHLTQFFLNEGILEELNNAFEKNVVVRNHEEIS